MKLYWRVTLNAQVKSDGRHFKHYLVMVQVSSFRLYRKRTVFRLCVTCRLTSSHVRSTSPRYAIFYPQSVVSGALFAITCTLVCKPHRCGLLREMLLVAWSH